MTKKQSIADHVSMERYDECVDNIMAELADTCDDVRVGYQIIVGVLAMLGEMNEKEPDEVIKDLVSMYTQVEAMEQLKEDLNIVQGNGTVN